ncbi:MAG: hypothetical protein AAF587_20595 [Bacteroidota bacterium]
MQKLTFQIQELLEGLEHLRHEQLAILHRNHLVDPNHIGNLPSRDLQEYQRLQRERNAKGKYLAELTGTKDDLKILLGQLSRLMAERQRLLDQKRIQNPLELSATELTEFTHLWAKSDRIASLLERLCRDHKTGILSCGR